MASEIDLICAVAAIIIGSVIGLYIALMEKRERDGILRQSNNDRNIGTEKKKKYHYYTCRHVKRRYRKGIDFDITFATKKNAMDMGYEPCKQCLSRF